MGNDQTYAHNSRSGGKGYNLKQLSGKGSRFGARTWDKMSSSRDKQASSQNDYRAEATAYSTQPAHGRKVSVESGISQHPIIRYQVDYEVRHEDKDFSRGTSNGTGSS